MDKLNLTERNLGRVFNSRLGHACISRAMAYITKQPNLKMKTWPKQLLGSLRLAFMLPIFVHQVQFNAFTGIHSNNRLQAFPQILG